MLSIPWSLFTNIEEEGQEKKRSRFNPNKPRPSMDVIGLQILIQLSQAASAGKSNLVVKPNLKLKKKPNLRTNRIDPASYYESSTFLKSCSLCNKNLSLDKDVYMYRGDQGYCSVECRNRQIYLDEMKEIEAYTKKMLSSFRQSRRPSSTSDSGHRCETRDLLEQFQERHKNRALVL